MSPLIWCMYYDPLLCEIESRELGYNLLHEQKTNVYDDQYNLASVDIADVAYMDDTTWITESKEALEEILAIADDFYKLNNIQVNKSKSKLLVNSPHDTLPETVELTFGSDKAQIKPAKNNESIRILGVWINLKGKHKFVIQQAKDEVQQTVNI